MTQTTSTTTQGGILIVLQLMIDSPARASQPGENDTNARHLSLHDRQGEKWPGKEEESSSGTHVCWVNIYTRVFLHFWPQH